MLIMNTVDVIIETPKGSKYKYKFDPKTNRFKLKKLLPAGLAFPYDFGFIPGTKGDDGDPLDVMIFAEDSYLPGSVIECKVIGAIKAKQLSEKETVRNDRIIVVPTLTIEEDKEVALGDFSKQKIKEIENFFIYYNKMERKEFKPLGVLSAKETWKLIEEGSEVV
jgi:inorganic pyrophosphatase